MFGMNPKETSLILTFHAYLKKLTRMANDIQQSHYTPPVKQKMGQQDNLGAELHRPKGGIGAATPKFWMN